MVEGATQQYSCKFCEKRGYLCNYKMRRLTVFPAFSIALTITFTFTFTKSKSSPVFAAGTDVLYGAISLFTKPPSNNYCHLNNLFCYLDKSFCLKIYEYIYKIKQYNHCSIILSPSNFILPLRSQNDK